MCDADGGFGQREESGAVAQQVVGLTGAHRAVKPGLGCRALRRAGGEERGPFGKLRRDLREQDPGVARSTDPTMTEWGWQLRPSAGGKHRSRAAERGQVRARIALRRSRTGGSFVQSVASGREQAEGGGQRLALRVSAPAGID